MEKSISFAAAQLALATLLISVSASAADNEVEANAFGRLNAGSWHATAAFFGSDYHYGPQYRCQMRTAGAELTQTRPRESGEMSSYWNLLEDERREVDKLEILALKINGKRFEVASLPWRLAAPAEGDGIIAAFDRKLLVIRQEQDQPWLPLVYLTSEMLTSKSFELEYSIGGEPLGQPKLRQISLNGFGKVAKWCGRQLLRDRLNEPKVRELTR